MPCRLRDARLRPFASLICYMQCTLQTEIVTQVHGPSVYVRDVRLQCIDRVLACGEPSVPGTSHTKECSPPQQHAAHLVKRICIHTALQHSAQTLEITTTWRVMRTSLVPLRDLRTHSIEGLMHMKAMRTRHGRWGAFDKRGTGMQRCEFIGADAFSHDVLLVGVKVQTQSQGCVNVWICVFRGAGIYSDPRLVHQSALGSLSPVRSDGLPALHRRLVSWTQGLVRGAFSKHIGLDLGRQRIKDVLVNAE